MKKSNKNILVGIKTNPSIDHLITAWISEEDPLMKLTLLEQPLVIILKSISHKEVK